MLLENYAVAGILVLYAILILSSVTVVVLENRQPAKTMAWILVLILLPVVGWVAYYFFGQNIRKGHRINKHTEPLYLHDARFGNAPEQRIDRALMPLSQLVYNCGGSAVSAGNDLTLLGNGRAFLDALTEAIASARSYVYLQTYILAADAVGETVADLLLAKAAEGVDVRLLYDDVGCWNTRDSYFRRLSRGGVKVEAFLPVRFPTLTDKVNYRNHRKICVVDGTLAFVGGMNLAERYLSPSWHDLHLRLTGPAAAALGHIFTTDWDSVAKSSRRASIASTPVPAAEPPTAAPPPCTAEVTVRDALVQIISPSPVSVMSEMECALVWILLNARRYVYMQTPYFMPTEPVLGAMQTAAMSGVDVRLMIPEKPDGFWLRWSGYSYVTEMLRAGVRVYFFRPGFLHSKAIVSDDRLCSIGSGNIDFRSLENNFETNAIIYDRSMSAAVRRVFETDMESCREILRDAWDRRPLLHRLLESNARIVSPLF